jgi:SAM-dependent methyltransferase
MVTLDGKEVQTFVELEALYRSRIPAFGMSSELLFYRSPEQHQKKLTAFARLLQAIDGVEGLSVLEIGCGYGALLDVFSPGPYYLGLDLVPEFVIEARKRYPDRNFQVGDILESVYASFDLCILAGVLSSVPDPTPMLERALQLATYGVVFDVTLHGRLPVDFLDLNRWTVDELLGITAGCGYRQLNLSDSTASWVLCLARRDY